MLELFLGSFLGFLSALGAEWTWRKWEDRREGKSLVAALRAEAGDNLTRVESQDEGELAFIGFLDSTVWAAAVSSNQLDKIAPRTTVVLAASMYRRLETVEKWETIRIQARAFGSSASGVMGELESIVRQARQAAKDSIQAFLEKIDD